MWSSSPDSTGTWEDGIMSWALFNREQRRVGDRRDPVDIDCRRSTATRLASRPQAAVASQTMKHTLYEHPVTHRFAVIRLPPRFIDGDSLVPPPSVQWFATREEALATLSNLFDQEEDVPDEDSLH
jgi:hypothetical protein